MRQPLERGACYLNIFLEAHAVGAGGLRGFPSDSQLSGRIARASHVRTYVVVASPLSVKHNMLTKWFRCGTLEPGKQRPSVEPHTAAVEAQPTDRNIIPLGGQHRIGTNHTNPNYRASKEANDGSTTERREGHDRG